MTTCAQIAQFEMAYQKSVTHEKNNFADIPSNLARYRSEDNFVWTIKLILWRTLLIARM